MPEDENRRHPTTVPTEGGDTLSEPVKRLRAQARCITAETSGPLFPVYCSHVLLFLAYSPIMTLYMENTDIYG